MAALSTYTCSVLALQPRANKLNCMQRVVRALADYAHRSVTNVASGVFESYNAALWLSGAKHPELNRHLAPAFAGAACRTVA